MNIGLSIDNNEEVVQEDIHYPPNERNDMREYQIFSTYPEVLVVPGISPEKQVKLYTKFCPLLSLDKRDIPCLYPGNDIMSAVKEKKTKAKKTRS